MIIHNLCTMPSASVSETALMKNYIGHTFVDDDRHLTIQTFYAAVLPDLLITLEEYFNDGREWKIQACLDVTVVKAQKECPTHFHISAKTTQSYSLDEEVNEMNRRLDEFVQKGSGWQLARVDKLEWRFVQFNSIPFHVGHARNFKLPSNLVSKKAVINVINAPDGECFKYAVLSVLHYTDIPNNNQRASKYRTWLQDLDFTGIVLPFQACDLSRFERQNPQLAINLIEWKKDGHARLARGSPVTEGRKVVNILIVGIHYVGVVHINRLFNDREAHAKNTRQYCDRCLRPFFTMIKLKEHLSACMKNEQREYKMPKHSLYTFNNWAKTISPSHVIYGDIECMLLSTGEHHPIMAAYLVVPNACIPKLMNIPPEYKQFQGRDCIQKMLAALETTCLELHQWNNRYSHETMDQLTLLEAGILNEATTCYLCQAKFGDFKRKKVADHDHFTGKFMGPACSSCNLLRSLRRSTFAIIFHNLRGYDAHHIIKEGVGHFPSWHLSVIPTTKEGYLSLRCSFGEEKRKTHLQFIDSLQFLSSSLASLVKNCPLLSLTSSLPGSDEIKKGKGIFPYNFLDSEEKLLSTHLPTQSAFFDNLTQSPLSDKDYSVAKRAWIEFDCHTFGDYTAAYLRLDVYQLADVFQAFRQLALRQDGLDPVNYVSLPGLSWDSAFKMTGAKLELLQDSTMYELFESSIRGGMCFVNNHRVQRTEATEILYIDANNLYGQALSMKLPQEHFKWVEDPSEQWNILKTLESMDILEADVGYLFEVDLHIPSELHDLFDDMPLAPENRTVQDPTAYMIELWSLAEGRKGYHAGRKLILSHLDKQNYGVHSAMLQFYIKMGAEVTKIHRVVSFRQSRFFESYIDFNSLQRQVASNEFERDFYKLKNNSLFGKTMENVRRRIDYRLCNTPEKLNTYASRPLFVSATRFSEDLVGVELLKGMVELDKPVFIGQAVLDLSKLIMYKLRYEKLSTYEKVFGGTIRVLAGDTDSFFLQVCKISVQNQLLPAMQADNLLDSSNYPHHHPLYSTSNKAKLGCIKDECAGVPIQDAIFLRPKCYSLLLRDESEHKRAKGVQRAVLRNQIVHGDYVDVVESAVPLYTNVRGFQSTAHTISTITLNKRALSLFEDKRAWVSGDKSFAYGHKDIPQFEPPMKKLRFSIQALLET